MTLANIPVDVYLIYDLATTNPKAIKIDAAWQGLVRWGVDVKGEPSRDIVNDNGVISFLDREGALDISLRTEGTYLTPGGRKVQLNELLGGNLGVMLLPAGSTNVREYLWRGTCVVLPREQTGEVRIELKSIVQNKLTQDAALTYEYDEDNPERYESRKIETLLKDALRLDEPVDIQTGDLLPPPRIRVENAKGRDLLKQAGIWGEGIGMVGLGGKVSIVSTDEMGTPRYDYEPIEIISQRDVDLRGDVQLASEQSIGDVTEISISATFNYAGNSDVFMHANGEIITIMFSGYSDNINNYYQYRPAFEDGLSLELQRRYSVRNSHFAVITPNRRVNSMSQPAYFAVLSGTSIRTLTFNPARQSYTIGAPITLRFGGINICWFANRLYTLHNDRVRFFTATPPVGVGSSSGDIAFRFADENRISNNSFISVGTNGVDILDADNERLYRYTPDGRIIANITTTGSLPVTQTIQGIATIGNSIYVLMCRTGFTRSFFENSNICTIYRLNLEGFRQPTIPVVNLPDKAPKWRIVDPEIKRPLLERPALNLALTGVSVTGIGDGEPDDEAPVKINARTSYLDERVESMDGWFVNNTETSRIAGWLSNTAVNPPNVLQLRLLIDGWDREYITAANRRLDTNTLISVLDNENLVNGRIIGRGLEWDYVFLYLDIAIWVHSRTPFKPAIPTNALIWRSNPVEWRNEVLTYG